MFAFKLRPTTKNGQAAALDFRRCQNGQSGEFTFNPHVHPLSGDIVTDSEGTWTHRVVRENEEGSIGGVCI